MLIVQIDWKEGRTQEQKNEVAKGITDVIVKACNIAPDRVSVIFRDIPIGNVGRGGTWGNK